jgi:23S rRNA pseudouridine1911/1915/1917 synthase
MLSPSIVLEDRSFLVVWKPSGMHTAPLQRGESNTLLAWVIERYPEIATVTGRKSVEPGLLHRIDRDTCGLVLFARNEESFARLMQAAADSLFRKFYTALCTRSSALPPGSRFLLPFPAPPCTVRTAFRSFGPRGRMVAAIPAESGRPTDSGRPPGTIPYETEVISIDPCDGSPPLLRAVVSLTRGFRHQVRVHLASSGLPIVGDELYGGAAEESAPLRLAAERLTFPHPQSGETVEVRGPVPWDCGRT